MVQPGASPVPSFVDINAPQRNSGFNATASLSLSSGEAEKLVLKFLVLSDTGSRQHQRHRFS